MHSHFQPSACWGNTFSFEKRCVMPIYFCGDGRQRPLLKLTLSEPGCQMQTDTYTDAQCALGLAVQLSPDESGAGRYDWDRWPFRTAMTRRWPQQVSLLQNMDFLNQDMCDRLRCAFSLVVCVCVNFTRQYLTATSEILIVFIGLKKRRDVDLRERWVGVCS